ncbi:restriction endonuclease subunit S [Streptomyces rhizosphaericus]|uniref:Type I restriction modification DNA specificity domain-containing protein n=1 Tax=Streptomyces rhizosphaericus TaxID=114699 RepID=A0ABN1Q556_9ACTN|nr:MULTISPECIES: restriction endonuclease subunit S [Streptomyces violaceusniger group]
MSGVGGELPKGWIRVRLDEIAEVRLGRQRSPKNHTGTHMRPYVRAANVGWNGLKLDDVKEMNFTDDEVETYRLKKGDIVLGEASGSAKEVGKPAIWNDEIPDCCFQNTLIRVRSHGVEPHYLLLFLRAEAMRGAFVEHSRGVGIHHIGAARLAGWSVPVPPVAEQQRIVTALEEQLSRLESAQTLLQRTNSRIAHLKTTVAQSLLNPGPCHTGWVVMRIGDIAKVGSGATPNRSRPEYYEGGTIPWVTSSLANRPFIEKAEQFITERALRETSVKLHPPGTLLVAMYGEGRTRGRCTELRISATTNQACASITLLPEHAHKKKWLREFLQASYERNRRLSAGGVQPNLNLSSIRNIEVHFPTQQVQDQILEELAEYQDSIVRIENANDIGARRAVMLRRSLLAEAFAGRLAPQDPNDEPAEELLARIRAEREAAAPKKRRTRRAPAQRKATHDEPPPAPATTSTTPLTGEQPTLDLEFPS